jgi:hypothetical protein
MALLSGETAIYITSQRQPTNVGFDLEELRAYAFSIGELKVRRLVMLQARICVSLRG